ncbi:MAG: hypothetical protein J6V22_04300, partial [Clostridia bacterium]|nr:hypothetical protein [Clostridia bacterium]
NGALQGDYQELTFKGGVVDLGKYAFLEGFRVYNSTDSDIALSEGNFILPVGAHFRDIDGNKIDVLAAYQTYAIVLDEVAWGTDADHLTSSGSLEDAVKAANEAEGALYIRVNKQLHLYDDITFDGCEVTLDFAGNMILAIADVSIKNGAKVTFVDKTDEGGIVSVEYYGIYVKKATLVIEGGSYGMSEELGYTSYEPFEIQNGADVTINGGNVTAIYEAFRVYGGAKLTVNDGTFTAGYSIFITLEIGSSNKSSTIVVNGGEFVNAGSDDFAHIAYTAKSNFDLTAMGDEIEGWLVEIHEYDLFGINGEGFLPEGYTLYDQYGMPGSHILTADIYEYYAGLFTIGKAPEESYTVTFVDTVFGGEDIVLTVYPENNEFTIFYDEMFKKPDTLLYLYFDEYGYKYDMDFLVTEDTIIYLEYELELLEAPTKENNALIKTAYDDQIASYVWYIRINEEYVLVEDETANSLQNPVYGYSYYVEAVMKNGKKAYFVYDHIDFTFVLEETSPVETTQKPFVELEDETGAKYQWYEVEITYGDEFGSDSELIVNAYEEENRNNLSYEEGRGWIVLPDSDDWCSYVKIYLQAGQTIGLTYDRDVIATSIWLDEDVANDQYTQWDGLIAGQTVFFTAEQEGWYEMDVKLSYALDIPAVRIDDVTVVETLLEGETQSVMQNPTINKSYICKISDAKDWSVLLQSPVINYENGFVKQPDSTTPGVEVADDTDGKYQWYTVDFGTEITDANAILLEGAQISFNYVEGLGWEGVAPQMAIKSTLANGAYYFAMFEAEEDESIRILFSVPVSGTLVIAGEDDEQIYVQLNNATYYEGKVAGAGMNGILLIVGNALSPTSTLALAPAAQVDNSTVYARIFIGESTKTPVEGETLATLQNPEFGTWYFCTVEDANGDVFESNVFQYTYVITKQPTMADPSIELNKTTGEESYQWYQITENGNEITPDSELFFAEEQASWYDSDNGWYGTLEYSGGVYADYIYIRLKEGQTITVVPSRNVEQIGIWQSENDVGDYIEYIYANEKAILTAPQDGIYVVYAGSFQIDNPIEEVTLRIYDNTNDGMVALEGETAATLSHNLPGTYVCVVTGVNGLSVTSEPLVIGAIVSIQKTSTDGLVDTYTITYT